MEPASLEPIQQIPVDEILCQRFGVDRAAVAAICERFRIVEMGLFGSALRDDFRSEGDDPSDVDLLVVFEAGYRRSWQEALALETALKELFQREVDVVLKKLLENPYRRAKILRTHQMIYAAR